MEENSKNKFLIPLVIAMFFAVGIFIGTLFAPKIQYQSQGEETTSKFSTILDVIEDKYVDSVDHDLLIESSIEGMIKKLDPHSQYIPPQDLDKVNEQLDGKFGGVGIRFLIHDDTLVVTHVLPNSPSEKSSIDEVASGCLSRLFGVKTIKGFLKFLFICLLSK